MKNNNLAKSIEVRNEKGQVIGTVQVVLYPELLNKAHSDGLKAIKTKIEQLPKEENKYTAIFSALVETEKGVFSGTGDASPENVAPEIAPHFIRAAETRAKARALRDALNVPIVSMEELGKELTDGKLLLGIIKASNNNKKPKNKDSSGNKESGAATKVPNRKTPTMPPANAKKERKQEEETKESFDESMTEAQRRYLFRLMSDKGIYGEEAHGELKKLFKVDSLKKVTKARAREMIDRILKQKEEVPF